MTNITIMRQVDSLPPLPQTIFEIENFKKNKGSDVGELISIIEKDPLIVSTLLKVSNSAMFGFVSRIETPSRAVNLLGVNFTLSIALASNMSKAINTDLVAYGKSGDDFLRLANMQSNFLNLWLGKVDRNLRDALILPVFLQESGKFLISDAIKSQKKEKEFLKEIESRYDEIHNVEKEFVGTTTSEVTSAVFKHWGLDENLVNDIKYADEPDLASVKSKEYSQILHIVKLVCNIVKPFDEVCIEKAKKLVVDCGYTLKPFEDSISRLEDRLLDEKDE